MVRWIKTNDFCTGRSMPIRPTFCTRLLFTVLPSPYTKKNLDELLSILAMDLESLDKDGVEVSQLVQPLIHLSMRKIPKTSFILNTRAIHIKISRLCYMCCKALPT